MPPCRIQTPNDQSTSCAPALQSKTVRTPAAPYSASAIGSGRNTQLGIATRKTNVLRCAGWLKNGATASPTKYARKTMPEQSRGLNHSARSDAASTVRSICVNTSAGNATSTTSRLSVAVNSAARNPRRRASQPTTITRNIAAILIKTT
jgi:hypothetical protein